MKTFVLEIITPEKKVFSGEVVSVTVPGTNGEFQVLFNHAPITSTLEIGMIKIVAGEGQTAELYACSGGVVEVHHNKVLILANTIEKMEQIDLGRAESSLARAKQRLAEKGMGQVDVARAELSVRRAMNRISIAKR